MQWGELLAGLLTVGLTGHASISVAGKVLRSAVSLASVDEGDN